MRHIRRLDFGSFMCRQCGENFQFVKHLTHEALRCPMCQFQIINNTVNLGYSGLQVVQDEIYLAGLTFKCPKRMRNRNNLRGVITADYGQNSFSQSLLIQEPVTFQLEEIARLSRATSRVMKRFEQFYDFMPLQIRPSFVAGRGIFATKNLQVNTYLGSYVGEIRKFTTESIANDSIVQIGWSGQDYWGICPQRYLNHGRYFNGSDLEHAANVRATWALNYTGQLNLVMFTNQRVRAGSELFWDYGRQFFFRNNPQQLPAEQL